MMLELKKLSIGYKQSLLKRPIDAKFEKSKLSVLFGNNGCGKTTLIKTIAKLIPAISGEITLDGKNIQNIEPAMYAKQVAFLFTQPPFTMNHTVFDMIALGRLPYLNWRANLSDQDENIIYHYSKLLGIENILLSPANQISDGQFQKMQIARTLAQQTNVIVLDEPLSHLDYKTKKDILNILKNIATSENKIVILSSHDIHLCKDFADNIFLIHNNDWMFETPENISNKLLFQDFFYSA